MGDANWWLPAWLDQILPTIDIEGETALPDPEMEEGIHRDEDRVMITVGS